MSEKPASAQVRIHTLDVDYLRPRFAAAYLVEHPTSGALAWVETGTSKCVERAVERVRDLGKDVEAVEWIAVTHVHLDHAGGASAFARAFPRARVLVHPRGARHLIDPAKLVASARQVYGAEAFDALYGVIEPIPAERVREVADGEVLDWSGTPWRFLHTRGHANHHYCVEIDGNLFTGDTGGLHYPDLDHGPRPFALPSTSPTDFDGPAARESLRRLAARGARIWYPTHFGPVTPEPARIATLDRGLARAEAWVEELVRAPGSVDGAHWGDARARLREEMNEHFRRELAEAWRVSEGSPEVAGGLEYLALDLDLNADGLIWVARRRADAKTPS